MIKQEKGITSIVTSHFTAEELKEKRDRLIELAAMLPSSKFGDTDTTVLIDMAWIMGDNHK